MLKGILSIVAITAAIALMGALGLTVTAGGSGLAHHLHGGGHHHDQMAELIEDLELTPDQQQRLDKVHEIMGNQGNGKHGAMAVLHEELMAQFQSGQVDNQAIRQAIDDHVEQVRVTAYAVSDELVALVNELDATQREILSAHLQGARAGGHGHGH